MRELYIRMIDGGKETELSVSNPNDKTEQLLLAGVLSFMDIELSEEFLRVQKMYADFYDGTFNPVLVENNEKVIVEVATDPKDMNDSELFALGMKRNKQDVLIYRCRYICPKCYYKGNHYINSSLKRMSCRKCESDIFVHKTLASPDEEQTYFYAGNYKTEEA